MFAVRSQKPQIETKRVYEEDLELNLPSPRHTEHIHDDDVEMYVSGKLESEHISTVESHLLECKACRESFYQCFGLQLEFRYTEITEASDQKHKRSEARFVTGDNALLQELNPLSLDRHKIRILDVSKHGIGVLIQRAIFPGTIVQIRIKDTIQVGEVRYCLPAGTEGYRVGLRLPRRSLH